MLAALGALNLKLLELTRLFHFLEPIGLRADETVRSRKTKQNSLCPPSNQGLNEGKNSLGREI